MKNTKLPQPPEFHFAILRHITGEDIHWDLLLELPGRSGLATWQIRRDPDLWVHPECSETGTWFLARALPDHRRIYLDYQGPISGRRGHVTQVDGGKLVIFFLNETRLEVGLTGRHYALRLILRRAESGADVWELHAEKDAD